MSVIHVRGTTELVIGLLGVIVCSVLCFVQILFILSGSDVYAAAIVASISAAFAVSSGAILWIGLCRSSLRLDDEKIINRNLNGHLAEIRWPDVQRIHVKRQWLFPYYKSLVIASAKTSIGMKLIKFSSVDSLVDCLDRVCPPGISIEYSPESLYSKRQHRQTSAVASTPGLIENSLLWTWRRRGFQPEYAFYPAPFLYFLITMPWSNLFVSVGLLSLFLVVLVLADCAEVLAFTRLRISPDGIAIGQRRTRRFVAWEKVTAVQFSSELKRPELYDLLPRRHIDILSSAAPLQIRVFQFPSERALLAAIRSHCPSSAISNSVVKRLVYLESQEE